MRCLLPLHINWAVILVLTLFVPSSVIAQTLKLGNYDYCQQRLYSEDWGKLCSELSEMMLTEFSHDDMFVVLEAEKRSLLIDLMNRERSTIEMDRSTVARIGELVGTGAILMTDLELRGNEVLVKARIVNVEKGTWNVPEYRPMNQQLFSTWSGIIPEIKTLVTTMLDRIYGRAQNLGTFGNKLLGDLWKNQRSYTGGQVIVLPPVQNGQFNESSLQLKALLEDKILEWNFWPINRADPDYKIGLYEFAARQGVSYVLETHYTSIGQNRLGFNAILRRVKDKAQIAQGDEEVSAEVLFSNNNITPGYPLDAYTWTWPPSRLTIETQWHHYALPGLSRIQNDQKWGTTLAGISLLAGIGIGAGYFGYQDAQSKRDSPVFRTQDQKNFYHDRMLLWRNTGLASGAILVGSLIINGIYLKKQL